MTPTRSWRTRPFIVFAIVMLGVLLLVYAATTPTSIKPLDSMSDPKTWSVLVASDGMEGSTSYIWDFVGDQGDRLSTELDLRIAQSTTSGSTSLRMVFLWVLDGQEVHRHDHEAFSYEGRDAPDKDWETVVSFGPSWSDDYPVLADDGRHELRLDISWVGTTEDHGRTDFVLSLENMELAGAPSDTVCSTEPCRWGWVGGTAVVGVVALGAYLYLARQVKAT